jgi:hypothetical protein
MNESSIAKKSVRCLKAITIGFSLMCIACSSVAFAYDFTLSAYGPNRVVVGHDLYIEEVSALTDGTRDYVYYFVDGLPTGVTASWPVIEATCCGGNTAYELQNTLLKINVPSTVPTGTYNLTLRVQSSGVTHTIPYTMIVDPVPGPLPKQPISAVPPIPLLSTWESQMKTYGKQLCNQANITGAGLWEGNVWYYDGIRVYYQIADYTKDSSWNACAGYVKSVFQPYVLSNSGAIPGWRVFPHGLYQEYLRTGDSDSKIATLELATKSAYASTGGGVNPGINDDDGLERETAYLVSAYRITGYLGSPNPLYARSVDFLLGMVDQIFVSKTNTYLKPFMAGLVMESLIQYYEDSQDPRVPPAIKVIADELWTRAWVPANKSFYYDSNTTPVVGSPDLNLLIAPAYAWLYKITGNPVYQQEGDLIFQGGVEGAWLAQGKQFNQSYRWSFDYVKWRLNPDIAATLQAPTSLRIIN